MLKIVGSILIVFSTGYFGMNYSRCIQNRIQELKILKRIFTELYGDVEYGACSLQESFYRIGEKQDSQYKEFLHYICFEMKQGRGVSFSHIMSNASEVLYDKSALKREDVEQLKSFASQLGIHQKDSQLRMIAIYLQDLELKISQLEGEKVSKQKLSQVLGISCGVLIVILLL